MIVQSWVASCSAAFLLFIGYTANTSATDASIDPAVGPMWLSDTERLLCSSGAQSTNFGIGRAEEEVILLFWSTLNHWTTESCSGRSACQCMRDHPEKSL